VNETSADHRRWLAQWQSAALELAEVRRQRLRRLTDAEALAASENLLSLAQMSSDHPRWSSSGLVLQQALLHRRSAS
jgi:hypothetical protein